MYVFSIIMHLCLIKVAQAKSIASRKSLEQFSQFKNMRFLIFLCNMTGIKVLLK